MFVNPVDWCGMIAFLVLCPEGAPDCSHGWSEAQPVDSDTLLSLALKGRRIPLPLQGSRFCGVADSTGSAKRSTRGYIP